jgi:hypothetical protein
MNPIITLILCVVLLALIKPLIRILMFLLVRTIFRKFLGEVGSRAMEQQPDQIHLTERPGHAWTDGAAVEALDAPLAAVGFTDAGTYGIDEMPEVFVRFLVKEDQRVAAAIYEHPKVGAWIDLFSHYQNETGITYTTARPTGLDERPGAKTVNAPGTRSEALYQRLLAERPAGAMEEITAGNVVRRFEDVYAKSTAWRKNKGVSADEVARNIKAAPLNVSASPHQSG